MIGIGTDFANLSGERSYSLSYYTKGALLYSLSRVVRPAERHSLSAEENCLPSNIASLRSVKGATLPCDACASIPCGLAVRKQYKMLFAASKVENENWIFGGDYMKKWIAATLCLALVFLLVSCGNPKSGDYPATIMVNGTNYYSTGNAVPVEVDESAIQYTTSYAEDGVPKKDGEANFNRDTGNPYAVLEGGMVVVLIDNEWIEFKSK